MLKTNFNSKFESEFLTKIIHFATFFMKSTKNKKQRVEANKIVPRKNSINPKFS